MNAVLMRRVAARIRGLDYVDEDSVHADGGTGVEGFDMGAVLYPCGTPACIAGWTLAIAGASGEQQDPDELACEQALLGLSNVQTNLLFIPDTAAARWSAGEHERGWVSPEHAARCLERLAESGEVDWEGTRP